VGEEGLKAKKLENIVVVVVTTARSASDGSEHLLQRRKHGHIKIPSTPHQSPKARPKTPLASTVPRTRATVPPPPLASPPENTTRSPAAMAPEPEDDILNEKNPRPLDEDDIALLKTYVSVTLVWISSTRSPGSRVVLLRGDSFSEWGLSAGLGVF
jgi:hypothetical protein